jgi:hypothetical protein
MGRRGPGGVGQVGKSEWSDGGFRARWVKFRCGMTSGATAGLKLPGEKVLFDPDSDSDPDPVNLSEVHNQKSIIWCSYSEH